MAPSHGAAYVPMLMLVVVWLSKGSTNEKMISLSPFWDNFFSHLRN